MPLAVKTAQELQEGVNSLDAQFATLLEEKDVSHHIRGLLGLVGLRKVVTLAGLSSNEELARTRLEKFLGITEDDGMELMIQTSNLLEAWRSARARTAAREEAQAEAAASGRLRDVPHVENRGMRDAHEKAHGERNDCEYPSRDYLGWRISQFETGHFAAEFLDQVVSHEMAGDDRQDPSLALQFTPGCNKVTAVRKNVTAPIPKTTEELRLRYLLIKTHWEVVRLRYPERFLFNGYRGEIWDEVVRHMLGPDVWQYRSRKGYGISWEDLLDYEYQVRKAAFKQITKGTPIHIALHDALHCTKLEQKYFTLQLCTTGMKHNDTPAAKATGGSGSSSSNNNADEDSKKRRQLDDELKQVKRLKQQLNEQLKLSQGKGKGKRYQQLPAPPPILALDNAPARGGGKAPQSAHKAKWNEIRKKEILEMKLAGTNQPICMFYQFHGCKHGEGLCNFAHVCMRCHRAGHACVDGECRGQPRLK